VLKARKQHIPNFIAPELATLSKHPPEGDRWLHEIKFDGYRILARVNKGAVQLWSRNQQEWTTKFRQLAECLESLNAESAWLDGEVIAIEPNGISSFQRLQNALRERRAGELIYQVFDLLYLDGYDLRAVPLARRKQLLAELLLDGDRQTRIRYTEHFAGDGPEFFRQAGRMGLEGIVSKDRTKPYVSGRSADWLKTKCVQRDEFVVGGFTDPSGTRHGIGALLVGYYDGEQRLHYAGKVGTGFSDRLLGELRQRLNRLEQQQSPFIDFGQDRVKRGTHWVEPALVAQVEYSEWTDDQILRHPSFAGLREDKPAATVRRDVPGDTTPNSTKRSGGRRTRQQQTSPPLAQNEAVIAGVRLTNADRVLYPGQGLTKLGLASYYSEVAPRMLPYLQGRPLALVRCPRGQLGKCFYQKHLGASTPELLRTVEIQERSKLSHYAVVDNVAGLVALAQIGVLEIHTWGSREDLLEKPDVLVFDLDPDPDLEWAQVVAAARDIRALLDELGFVSFVKTTGGKGLHVVTPIRRKYEWPEIKQFARGFAELAAARSPQRFTTNMSKAVRRGKIFLDYLRNERGATFVCPYSTRANPGASVSTPLAWDELSPAIRSDHYHVDNVLVRLRSLRADPWAEFFKIKQSLTATVMKQIAAAQR
jgi:bifunctional non-homologous end joining protein LigD